MNELQKELTELIKNQGRDSQIKEQEWVDLKLDLKKTITKESQKESWPETAKKLHLVASNLSLDQVTDEDCQMQFKAIIKLLTNPYKMLKQSSAASNKIPNQ